MADRLAALLSHFQLRTHVFQAGLLCGIGQFDAPKPSEPACGHLHLLRGGHLTLEVDGHKPVVYREPTLLFFVKPQAHRLLASEADTANLVCAEIQFGVSAQSPALSALPNWFAIPLFSVQELASLLDLLFAEAFAEHCGRQNALDLLAELLLIHLLRHAMEQHQIKVGLLAGLADPRLRRALVAIHEQPGEAWSLDRMAALCSMSRARFAEHFKTTVGQTPNDYLSDWRIGVAMQQLKRGVAIKVVANAVGYADGSALARVFIGKIGLSPKTWLASQR